jgi:hypothetical protein
MPWRQWIKIRGQRELRCDQVKVCLPVKIDTNSAILREIPQKIVSVVFLHLKSRNKQSQAIQQQRLQLLAKNHPCSWSSKMQPPYL